MLSPSFCSPKPSEIHPAADSVGQLGRNDRDQLKSLVDEPQHGAKEQALSDTLNVAERSVGKVASPP
jgi:hypothetical protein